MKIREKESKDQCWIDQLLNERWGGGGRVVAHGETFDARTLPAIIAGEQGGLATYQVRKANDCIFAELITLDALTPGRRVGTAVIDGLVSKLRVEGVNVVRVATTNDNLDALQFYQLRGFRIIASGEPGLIEEIRERPPFGVLQKLGRFYRLVKPRGSK